MDGLGSQHASESAMLVTPDLTVYAPQIYPNILP